ncbi:RING/U-box superfamily protein [Prunus dulcis]|uniref:RING/U-box superfamily protein n=1 Tax=Prunus dulcis TaxID=3755 RepID=A0A4Y1S2D0_PRUDU|nr:RING/U-box superfamily protein [Prunus dulcis]
MEDEESATQQRGSQILSRHKAAHLAKKSSWRLLAGSFEYMSSRKKKRGSRKKEEERFGVVTITSSPQPGFRLRAWNRKRARTMKSALSVWMNFQRENKSPKRLASTNSMKTAF